VRGKPKPEQPEYNGRDNETGTEDNEHWAITKSRAGLDWRLDRATFFLAHRCLLSFRQENATSSYQFPAVLNVSFHACHAFHAFQQFQKNTTTFGGEVEPMEFLVVMEDRWWPSLS
jgi:hypothetical protein